MATKNLNKTAYEIAADNLVAAAQYPMLHRAVTIANPKAAIERGTAVVNDGGTLYVAGTKDHDKDVIAIVSADHEADAEADTVTVDAFVSGAFNASHVIGINDWDASTAAHVLGAQGNGIYLL